MSTKHFKELKSMSADELKTKLRDSEAQLFDAKMKKATGQLSETGMLWRLRKDIARIKMLQTDQSNKTSVAKAGK